MRIVNDNNYSCNYRKEPSISDDDKVIVTVGRWNI